VPRPIPLTVSAAAAETYEGELVRVRGRVVRTGSNDGGKYLILNGLRGENAAQVSVFVPNGRLGQMELGRFEAGDEVKATGVLSQFDYEAPYAEYYQVLPRDSGDLAHTGLTSTYLWIALYVLLGGGLLAVVAVVMLRTAVKRRAQELAESRARAERLAEATSEGIAIHGEGRIVSVNEALVEMTERDREDLIGRKVGAALADMTRGLDDKSLYETPDELTEAEVVREEGTAVPVELEAREITAGDHPAHVVAMRDISKRKEWEEGILRAKQEAEEAARLKTAMLANMSHEIRTPLTSIIGFSEVLKDRLDEEMAVFAERAYRSSQRLMNTLESVLHLSKLEAGTHDVEREPVRLDRVVQETINLHRPGAEEKSISLGMEKPDGPVTGFVNESALERISENLIGNAIKFTPEEGSVEVRVWEKEKEVILEVRDSGVGVGEEAQARIFEAFEQESGGLDRDYEGSGLGLSIVQRLVELHGGTVDVESSKGGGSTFTVRLPLPSTNGELSG
jgi:PAS domain S-box-containing protein